MNGYIVNLNDVGRYVAEDIRPLIKEYTFALEEELVHRIQDGPKTGRTYRRSAIKRRRKGQRVVTGYTFHRASAPGESPATDYGILVNSIKARFPSQYEGEVFIAANYADILETELQRPFVTPAIEEVTKGR